MPNDVARLAALLREMGKTENPSTDRDYHVAQADWLIARGVTLAEAPPTALERLRLRAALEQIRDMDDGVVFACARAIAAAALGNSDYECPEEMP